MTDWLLDTLIATSALMVLALLLREPVRRRFGSRVAYALWLLPAARMLMPTLTTTVERTVPAPVVTPAMISPAVSLEPRLLASVATHPQTLVEAMGGWPTILLTLWLGIAAGLFLNRIIAFRRERRLILDQSVQLARLGTVRLVRSRAVTGPLAFGLIDRVVAVPHDFDRRFDDRERCLALDHELAHHRSGDLIANQFAFVLLCLQWFNPLAWASYAAFRFDQEAACDARVLDKAAPHDRADYGRAIAKAASGRALLFSAALDRPTMLHRRLKSMLNPTQRGRRIAGTAMVVAAIAIVLPLTATRAIDYVDVLAAPKPVVPAVAPIAPVPVVAAQAPAAPISPLPPMPIKGDKVMVNGNDIDWGKMSPTERAEMRRELAEARREIADGRAEAAREIANARRELEAADIEGELAGARREIEAAMRDIDANAAELRRAGQDPEMIKAQVRASLQNLDIAAIKRSALAGIDEKVIEASIRAAEQSIERMEAELDRLDRRGE
jgi:bla regulator protein BlaR1